MDTSEANEHFARADALYCEGKYEASLEELAVLEVSYPDNHRLLNAKARTLERLNRNEEALAIYNRLVSEFNYNKVLPRRDWLAERIRAGGAANEYAAKPGGIEVTDEQNAQTDTRRFRVKPVRLLLLLAILAGMYSGYVPYWIGVSVIAAYFGVKLLTRWVIYRLFTIPFRMKGKALAGAQLELHGFEWTDKPDSKDDTDCEDDEDVPGDRRYVWIDVTVIPPERTSNFTHWEPGELALAPYKLKYKGLDDIDHCFPLRQIRFVSPTHADGSSESNDIGSKWHGPARFKALAAIPNSQDHFKFVYYFESFGEIRLKQDVTHTGK